MTNTNLLFICSDTRTPYDFRESSKDIKTIEDSLLSFIKQEVELRLRKQLQEPRFQLKTSARLSGIDVVEKRPKGILTRIKEGDKTLNEVQNDWKKDGKAVLEKNAFRNSAMLMIERCTNADDLLF